MFIQTEDTPNPQTLKFLPGRDVIGEGVASREFLRGGDLSGAPLAEMLFMIPGITRIFYGINFVSVTKDDDQKWPHLKPAVLGAIMDFYQAGGQALSGDMPQMSDDQDAEFTYEGETAEIVEQIKEIIDLRVKPAVAQDGGDIVFRRYIEDEGVVYLEMRGACAGCPSSTLTLKSGIENLLKHYVPEVTRVEQAT